MVKHLFTRILFQHLKSCTGKETCFALIDRVTDVHQVIQINETSIHTVETSDIIIESTVTERLVMLQGIF